MDGRLVFLDQPLIKIPRKIKFHDNEYKRN